MRRQHCATVPPYVGSTAGLFHAIGIQDGRHLWTFSAGRPILGEALVTAQHVYFPCDDGYLYKLDRHTGKQVWRYDLGDERATRFLPHPVTGGANFDFDIESPRAVLVEGMIFVGSGDGSVHAIDDAAGTRRWRFAGQGK